MTEATPLASEQITQEDREAAADMLRDSWDYASASAMVTNGEWDEHELVQAFARHRIAALSATPALSDQDASQARGEGLRALVWQRGDEWVLEIEGVIDGVFFNSRHTQPLSVAKHDVPGLPTHYAEPAPGATPTIPAGMVAWNGGDNPPGDWDNKNGDVLWRNGERVSPEWAKDHCDWQWSHSRTASDDIIAYTPLAAAPKQAEQQGVEVERLRDAIYRYQCKAGLAAEDAGEDAHGIADAILAALNAPTGAVEKGEAK